MARLYIKLYTVRSFSVGRNENMKVTEVNRVKILWCSKFVPKLKASQKYNYRLMCEYELENEHLIAFRNLLFFNLTVILFV
jgi:ribosomal protein S26